MLKSHPEKFTFSEFDEGIVHIRDFQTTGVVAYARGCPFYDLPSGRARRHGQRIQGNEPYRVQCVAAVEDLVEKL